MSGFTRIDGILATDAHGETVLLRLSDGGYFSLDEVGSQVWNCCEQPASLEEIVAAVSAEFDAPPEVIRSDVGELLDELVAEGLLERGA